MNKRRALVTGASGYVGSQLARRLVADGWEVHVLLRAGSSLAALAGVNVTLHRCGTTTADLVEIVRMAAPDAVFHLAALFLAQHRPEEVAGLVQANILFSTQLAEAMAANGVRILVNTGTAWQHFEGRDYDPVNLYAATKQAFEAILAYYVNAAGMSVATLALFDTYGPHDPRPKLMSALWKAAASGGALSMSAGDQLLDMVYIDDVVEAYLATERALRAAGPVQLRYGVSSGAPLRLKDLVAAFEAALGVRVNVGWGERPCRPRETMLPWTRFEAPPGWQPRMPFEEGMRRSVPPGFVAAPLGISTKDA
ncbi:NAD-dependent epimerase/dehydratase family protein [Massilia sp. CMS3.1]|uniref:NAD-dependent epimerase/dehydratase family protein n=1 Tax=Massilia sp. CMS3.1 TaxID=3373083 RepID=UPI003EE52861